MRRVPWAEWRSALVWFPNASMWRECYGTTTGGGRYEAWESKDGSCIPDGHAGVRTAHLPDQCRTCYGFRCGCPGEGWEVPVHVRLPTAGAAAEMRDAARPHLVHVRTVGQPVDDGRIVSLWQGLGYAIVEAGTSCPPCVPYINGRPVWVDPWEG